MSNRTIAGAKSVHGSDPQLLIEKITRERIYACRYWKEKCFGLTAETIIDRAVALTSIGGSFGAQQRPSEFLCLLLKLLQLQPAPEVVETYLAAEECKYLRCLAAAYWRFTQSPVAVYGTLEPLYADFRKVRLRRRDGTHALLRLDEFVAMLVREERMFEVMMPRLVKRQVLEDTGHLDGPRVSLLGGLELELELEQEQEEVVERSVSAPTEAQDGRRTQATPLDEIEQENALRAKLGLKPLQR